MGFDQLMQLVPSLASQKNSKVSKATVLQKSTSGDEAENLTAQQLAFL